MNAIDQYKITQSWKQSLVPAPALIDSRTEQDRLNFLCNYASLINFYDSNNQLKGNWEPFLIKDPVFLLAHIAKTRSTAMHSHYLNTCTTLDRLTQPKPPKHPDNYQMDLDSAFNVLFAGLTDVFVHIKRWIYFMQMTNDEYDLKTYIIYQTKTNFSQYYWALTSLQQGMYMASVTKGIDPVDHYRFYFFDTYEEKIWKENKGNNPYWKILDLENPLKENTSAGIYHAIKNAGDKLFAFFHMLVKNADTEFELLKSKKSKYPDTTLLRAFVHLLKQHQDQLNGISQKHLQFYYKDVLKQAGKPAVPDNVYLCSKLAKPVSTFSLPAGTVFSAGLDAQKKPILFSTTATVDLNPATITGGYTLSKSARPGAHEPFYLKNIPAAGAIQKDKTGKIQSWATFGGSAALQQTVIKPGIAFASPLLFLQEGIRDISLSVTFLNQVDPASMPAVKYFLSTLGGWLEVTDRIVSSKYTDYGLNAEIKLIATDLPVQAFQKINPDGIDSPWPLLKLEFDAFEDTAHPPIINGLTITVNVDGMNTFQLFNDYGSLSTKTPFQLFGPGPMVNSNFIIGSNEIFSKPFNSLVIELNWDQLPTDFAVYYERYNTYIDHPVPPLPKPASPPLRSIPTPPPPPRGCWLWRFIKSWFCTPVVIADEPTPFNDECFTVNFSLLQDAAWQELLMTRYIKNPLVVSNNQFIPNPANSPDPQPAGTDVGLFVPVFDLDENGHWADACLSSSSIFGYPPDPKVTGPAEAGDPGLQNTVLKFTDSSSSGFIRMTLSGPESYGFGSGMYADVVSCIALTNAMAMSNKLCPPPFSTPAKPPFVPKLANFTGYYGATCTYEFPAGANPETYPLQCFLYTPFNNYLVYDNSKPVNVIPKPVKYNYIVADPDTTSTATNGIPLFDPFNYDGYLFLQMDDLLPASSFNIYFDLSRSYKSKPATKDIGYFYVSKTGWKKLPLLADGTNKFSCSGIITVAVPDDIANDAPVMPGSSYWVCIAVLDPAASFSQTVFFQTNGFMANRCSSISSLDTTTPKLAANIISKPQTAIPQVAATVQPFASFGGEAAETYTDMNRRISSRMLTKDRVVFAADYTTLITQRFGDIYFAKAVFDSKTENTGAYVVRGYADWTDPNAFLPLVSLCLEEKITRYLAQKASAFANITVSNFSIQYVKVFANIILAAGAEPTDMEQTINQALNIFLSPWISSNAQQVIIGQPISGAMVANLLKNITGVLSVEQVHFQSWGLNAKIPSKWSVIGKLTGEPSVAPASATALLVSCMDHHIQFKS